MFWKAAKNFHFPTKSFANDSGYMQRGGFSHEEADVAGALASFGGVRWQRPVVGVSERIGGPTVPNRNGEKLILRHTRHWFY